MKNPLFYAIMVTVKTTSHGACGSFEVGRKICDLRSDHSFDHLQVWTTWEIWILRHKKARFSDEKARKSTQNEAKDGYCFLWDQDVAGSNPVIPTKKSKTVLAAVLLFLLEAIV